MSAPTWAARRASLAVDCHRCPSRRGRECRSTGGGNSTPVPPHKARQDRIAHWDDALIIEACEVITALRSRLPRTDGADLAAALDRFEALAAPRPERSAAPSPRAVELSEAQAARIEVTAENLRSFCSTAHFSGDAQRRRTVLALESKGILAEAGRTPDGYDRIMVLTDYGWDVYRQHKRIIRRLADPDGQQARARCACACPADHGARDCPIHAVPEYSR